MSEKEKCKCGNKEILEHECPFLVDIHDDCESLCNCCEACISECWADI